MHHYAVTPPMAPLVERLLGTPYEQMHCRDAIAWMFREGFGLDLATDSAAVTRNFCEVWYYGNAEDPLELIMPWDLVIYAHDPAWPVSSHVGVMIDETRFLHARNGGIGVVVERFRRWRPKLVQVARYKVLM